MRMQSVRALRAALVEAYELNMGLAGRKRRWGNRRGEGMGAHLFVS